MPRGEGGSIFELLLESLDNVGDLADLQSVAEQFRDYFRVDDLIYHWVSTTGEQYGVATYDDAWQARYLEQDYVRVDPVVQNLIQRFHPADWKQLNWSGKAARDFRADAAAHGVGHQGFTVPIRGPSGQFAIFTVSHSCPDPVWWAFIEEKRRELILTGHYFNQKALEMEPGRQPESGNALSPREVDAMTFLAMGYSRAQVADTLSISEHTLRVYIESARHKLRAANTTHAVARALQQGLIMV